MRDAEESFRPLIGVIISKRIMAAAGSILAVIVSVPLSGLSFLNNHHFFFHISTFRFRPLIGVIISKLAIYIRVSSLDQAFPSPYRGYHF